MKNIVFDMGNVLTKYKLSDYIGTYTEDEAQAALLKNQVCASVEWICMDRGTMTDEEAVRSICKRIPQSEWELVERFVRELKEQGYHLFLMSNTSHRFRAFSKNIPSVGYMDGIWISCECGYLKPEREAYVDFFRKMKIEPQESYFVDDSPANIEAGIRLGMRGCVYHQDMPELRRNLREAGIDLKDA